MAMIVEQERVKQALKFINSQQSATGELYTSVSDSKELSNGKDILSVYIPTFIAHSLSFVEDSPLATKILKGIEQFLIHHREASGTWRFFGVDGRLPSPDWDDTCCALSALHNIGVKGFHRETFDSLKNYQADSGLYYTWLDQKLNTEGFYHTDGAVNANILFYAGLNDIDCPAITEYLNYIANRGKFDKLSLYSVNPYPGCYLITRAFADGNVSGLESACTKIVNFLLGCQVADNWSTPFDTVLSALCLINAGYNGPQLSVAFQYLTKLQRNDGSWPAAVFFQDFHPNYYGAETLTTALCVELFSKLQRKA